MRSSRSIAASSVVFLLSSGVVWAQTLAANTDTTGASDGLDQIIVTGSRQSGLKAADSPAPIQVIGVEALRATGAPDLPTALAQVVPSFVMQAYGNDLAGETFGDSCFADAGIANKQRVVLLPAAQNLNRALDLRITSN